MITSKEQERKALQQIKAIVDGLGEGSYLAAAFDGCFALAEENINNDWTISLPQRIEALQADMVAMNDDNQELLEKNRILEAELQKANSRTCLPREDLKKLLLLCESKSSECQDKVCERAATIVEFAEDPGNEKFAKAVYEHRMYKHISEDMQRLRETLSKIITGE